jgi:hypothetical protein
VLPLRGVAGVWQVMLVPFAEGQKPPVTAWDPSRTRLRVAWPDQQDTFAFEALADGRTAFTLDQTTGSGQQRSLSFGRGARPDAGLLEETQR